MSFDVTRSWHLCHIFDGIAQIFEPIVMLPIDHDNRTSTEGKNLENDNAVSFAILYKISLNRFVNLLTRAKDSALV